MSQRKPFICNQKIETTPEGKDAALKKFEEVMQDAPKPNEHRDRPVIVNHQYIRSNKIIKITQDNIDELLNQHGLLKQMKSNKPTDSSTNETNLTEKSSNIFKKS